RSISEGAQRQRNDVPSSGEQLRCACSEGRGRSAFDCNAGSCRDERIEISAECDAWSEAAGFLKLALANEKCGEARTTFGRSKALGQPPANRPEADDAERLAAGCQSNLIPRGRRGIILAERHNDFPAKGLTPGRVP